MFSNFKNSRKWSTLVLTLDVSVTKEILILMPRLKKGEDTLFSPTFKVQENKVPLFNSFLASVTS